jgi:hypothetical protein
MPSKEKKRERKRKKKRKKEKKRKRSDSSSSYSSGEEEERRVKKRLLKKARKFLEKAKTSKTTSRKSLSEDDYFNKNREFRVWLEGRDMNFEDLSTEKAKKFFTKFVKRWNEGSLESKFYDGAVEQVRTKHKWSFTSKIDDAERMKLASVRDRVELQTHSEKKAVRLLEKRDRRRYNERRRVVEDELVPRETGFQAKIAKRREKSDRIHGASRHRDDGLSVSNSVLMGDDSSSLRDAKRHQERMNERRNRKYNEQNARLMAAKAKEDAKMAAFMKEFGLNNPNAQRIKIQPRRN